jgi:hypothetical protein
MQRWNFRFGWKGRNSKGLLKIPRPLCRRVLCKCECTFIWMYNIQSWVQQGQGKTWTIFASIRLATNDDGGYAKTASSLFLYPAKCMHNYSKPTCINFENSSRLRCQDASLQKMTVRLMFNTMLKWLILPIRNQEQGGALPREAYNNYTLHL